MTPAEIKNRFRLREEIASRGIEVNRAGFCRCPFHQGDNTASLKVYDDQNTWHCYGCGQGGDIIDFVRLADGLSFRDACKAISGEELSREKKYRIDRVKMKREAERIRREKKEREIRKLAEKVGDYWSELQEIDPVERGYTYGLILARWQCASYKLDCLTGETGATW